MRQLVQSVRSGELELIDTPEPVVGPTEVLVRPSFSVVSAGTERAVRKLASASLLAKARARPDLVKQVIRRARSTGLRTTAQAVRSRLDETMALGYSAAGTVVRVGEAVEGLRPGMQVATAGAGHAELQVVAGLLAVAFDDRVSASDAAFATIGAIALQGIRVSGVEMGGRMAVIGLGLIGQITARLALAAGIDVVGIDIRDWTVQLATASGAHGLLEKGEETTRAVLDWSRGHGVDAVLITAATPSSDPARRAPALARDRAAVVVVGDVGLDLDRTPFYEKELSLRFARSYGPGRYARSYEDWAVDYPIGQVRWTEGRNIETFLGLVGSGRLRVDDLVTQRYDFADARAAYALLDDKTARYLGIQLVYPQPGPGRGPAQSPPPGAAAQPAPPPRILPGRGIGLIGAGNFAKGVLVPAFKSAGMEQFVAVTSARGASAQRMAEQVAFGSIAASVEELLANPGVDVAVIASPHDTHAAYAQQALAAGKHVFCEKPLALSAAELDAVEAAWRAHGGHLMVGFNRRHSPAVAQARAALGPSGGPLVVNVRVNAGELPAKHWYNDRRQGGRVLGELCHFIDTCDALVGMPAGWVGALRSGRPELALDADVVVTLGYPDGSLATIAYASGGHPSMPKERFEILGRGHSVVIDDFTELSIDGRTQRLGSQDKGHVAQLVPFREALERGGDPAATEAALASMRATLAVIESLMTGQMVARPAGDPTRTGPPMAPAGAAPAPGS